MNQGRQDRPLYIARNIAEYEKGLNRIGVRGEDRTKELEKAFAMPMRNIQRYKRILNFPEDLQLLFRYPQKEIPYIAMIDKIIPKVTEDKAKEFAYAFNTVFESGEEITSQRLEQLYSTVFSDNDESKKLTVKKVKANQILKGYKNFMSVEYDENGNVIVNKKKKETILAEAKAISEKINEIIEAYENEN